MGMVHVCAGDGMQRWYTHASRDPWEGVWGWHVLEWYAGMGHRHAGKYTRDGAWRCDAEIAQGYAGTVHSSGDMVYPEVLQMRRPHPYHI